MGGSIRCALATIDFRPCRSADFVLPMAIDTSLTTPQLQAASEFKRCLRERLRHAREVAALRARFATAVEDYESEVLHPTNPKWGAAALVGYADGHFLKKEQDAIDRLLHQLP